MDIIKEFSWMLANCRFLVFRAMARTPLLKGMMLSIVTVFAGCANAGSGPEVPQMRGDAGKLDGVWTWRLPDAPDGTKPDQCWHAVGSSPGGDIYISGHDHKNNSMLYRLSMDDSILRWVGDAATASKAANNWKEGETAQKFHTRPLYHNGQVYVATTDRSSIDDAYKQTRGFHWYAYETERDNFVDLSASEPDGIGAPHIQIVTIQIDPRRNLLYGASIPEGRILQYDIARKRTVDLGRPKSWNQYFYSNRFMWIDSRGRLYISGGSERPRWNQNEPKSVFDHIHFYDPDIGFGDLKEFKLQGANAIETGQWNRDRTRCYLADDRGHIYRFDDEAATFNYLGKNDHDDSNRMWVFNLSLDEERIYLGVCDEDLSIYEFDTKTGNSRRICRTKELDNKISDYALTGYDTWDVDGNFYFASFKNYDGQNACLTRFNPVRAKVAKGILPELVEVTVQLSGEELVVIRSGGTQNVLEVIYELVGLNSDGNTVSRAYASLDIPKGRQSVALLPDKLSLSNDRRIRAVELSILPDGNDYVVGRQRTVELSLGN